MPADPVSEIDGPWEVGGESIGIIGNPCEQAADSADGDSDGHGNCKQVAGAAGDALPAFDPLDREGAAEESTDHGFARHPSGRVRSVSKDPRRVFEPSENLGAERRPADGCGNDCPTGAGFQEVA